jgi:hypothetical protein
VALYKKNLSAPQAKGEGIFEPYSFHNQFYGQSCFLCGTGPSLKKVDPQTVYHKNLPIMGLNNSFKYITPNIWMGVDTPDCFHPDLFSSNFMKIYLWEHRNKKVKKQKVCDLDNFYFFTKVDKKLDPNLIDSVGACIPFIFEGNTFSSAVHMLYWMGFKCVYLIGCDFGGSNAISQMGPKFKKTDYPLRIQKKLLHKALDFLEFSAQNNGVRYISCTPHSPINEFLEYKDLNKINLF